MDFWLRSATLQIGGNRYSMDDLAFDFEVPFEDSDELTTATVNAYNLSANTRNSIKKGDPVIINAGYEGDLGVIFVGQVSGLSHKHSSTEWTTKITATEALDQWLTAQVNKTYTKSIKAKAMVQDLLNIFGIEVGTFELAIDKEYPRGRVCKGKLKDVFEGNRRERLQEPVPHPLRENHHQQPDGRREQRLPAIAGDRPPPHG